MRLICTILSIFFILNSSNSQGQTTDDKRRIEEEKLIIYKPSSSQEQEKQPQTQVQPPIDRREYFQQIANKKHATLNDACSILNYLMHTNFETFNEYCVFLIEKDVRVERRRTRD